MQLLFIGAGHPATVVLVNGAASDLLGPGLGFFRRGVDPFAMGEGWASAKTGRSEGERDADAVVHEFSLTEVTVSGQEPVALKSGGRVKFIARALFLALALGLDALSASAAEVTIRSCDEGDTCQTTAGERLRLACIAVPPRKEKPRFRATSMQAFAYDNTEADASRDFLSGMVEGQAVVIRRINTDRDGRTVAELFVNGINVQQAMVAAGHALIAQPMCLRSAP